MNDFPISQQTLISIELLDIRERPITRIEGEVISGSGSIDGDSSVRRTMSLIFLTKDDNYKILETSNKISINKKIRVQIGQINSLNNKIKWHKMGIYIMSKCSSSASVQGRQIAVTLQDKMCLHNGDISGKLEYTTRLDSTESIPLFNNLLSEMQEKFLEAQAFPDHLQENFQRIKSILKEIYNNIYGENFILENEISVLLTDIDTILLIEDKDSEDFLKKMKELSENISLLNVDSRRRKLTIREIIKYSAISLGGELPGKVIINDVPDKIRTPIFLNKEQGIIGYKMIRFIYPEELTLNTGQPITTIYEKCKEALGGNYEYFYDLDGNFVFQEIKNYLHNNIPKIEDLKASNYKYSFEKTPIQFDFSKYPIVTDYHVTPNWNNIKNDFYVWGKNEDHLIGYHAVIDDKPIVPYYVQDLLNSSKTMDWREYIIHNHDIGEENNFVGKCFEKDLNQMYTKVQNPVACVIKEDKKLHYMFYKENKWNELDLSLQRRSLDPSPYYRELSSIWKSDRYYEDYTLKPSTSFNFNFDIIEGDEELSKFSVKTIGRRKEPKEDKNIKQLYPTIVQERLVYYDDEDLKYTSNPESALKLSQISDFRNFPSAGNIYKDAFSSIKKEIFSHTLYNEQVQIRTIPIYDLEVNRRCYVYFKETNTNGFFMTKKISYSINSGDIMTVSLIKAQDLNA